MPDTINEKLKRPIVLRGGDCPEMTMETKQDYVYVINSTPAYDLDNGPLVTKQGNWNRAVYAGTFQTAKLFNASGKFQEIAGKKHEIFSYVGNDQDSVFVAAKQGTDNKA